MLHKHLLPALLTATAAQAAQIYASHYDGTISLVTLANSSDSADDALTETSKITGGGSMPSWLTWNPATRKLYCSDEQFFFGSGSISAFEADDAGELTELAKATAPLGGVANVLYGGENADGFIALAHYQSSTVSTFKLPLEDSSTALQEFTYELDEPGTVPSRQDAPHPHHVILDPTTDFLMVPDLGADLIRIYSIDQETGNLTSCTDAEATPGDGPRHGTFWTSETAGTMLFVANELANTVARYSVAYAEDGSCPSVTHEQDLTPYADNEPAPDGTKVAEVHVKDNFLYMANRNDLAFDPDDSITQYAISPEDGSLSFVALTSSHGWYPRTFDINSAGDMVVIGDQTSSNLVVVTRDPETGALGEVLGDLRIGSEGTPEREDGLSAVVWVE